MNEWVRIDDGVEIEDMSRARVKILDPEEVGKNLETNKDAEDIPFCETIKDRSPGEVLERFVEKYIPKSSIISKVNNPIVNQATFTINNFR